MATPLIRKIEKQIKEQSEPLSSHNAKALEFIKYVASRTGVDISSWNLWDIFGGEDSDGNKLVDDKRTVGKVFMEKLEELQKKDETKKDSSSVKNLPGLMEAIEKKVKASLDRRIRDLNTNITGYCNRAKSYSEAAKNELVRMNECVVELERLSGNEPAEKLIEELDQVVAEGLWTNPVCDNGWLYLNTSVNVVNTLINKAADIDMAVDLGQMAIKIDLNSFTFYIIPYKYNKSVTKNGERFFHPHVTPDGSMCLGNTSDRIYDWMKSMDLAKILKLVYTSLMTYNDENPYCSLYYFKNGRGYGKTSEFLRHPDKKKDKKKKEESVAVTNASGYTIGVLTVNDSDINTNSSDNY